MHYHRGKHACLLWASEILAITGAHIDGVKIVTKGFIGPFQRAVKHSIQARDYTINLQAMTKEKLQLSVPVVFAIGPDGAKNNSNDDHQITNEAPLRKYIALIGGDSNKADNTINSIIEGETREVVSPMTMEELFTSRDIFETKVREAIQEDLEQFGLKFYNVNIKELMDGEGSDYFKISSRRAKEGVTHKSTVEVAKLTMTGVTEATEQQSLQEIKTAEDHANTAVAKNQQESRRAQADAELEKKRLLFARDVHITKIEATRANEVKDEELKKALHIQKADTEIARLRSSDVVKATAQKEVDEQKAEAKAIEARSLVDTEYFKQKRQTDAAEYKTKKDYEVLYIKEQEGADSRAYKTKVDSEAAELASRKTADAKYYQITKEAEARFIVAQQEAEGILIKQNKEAQGLKNMAEAYGALAQAFGGPQGLIQYMMIEKGTYNQLAQANASALQGMAPKMTIWNTGSGGEGEGNDPAAAIRNSYQMLPPLMSTIHEQTGLELPAWKFGKIGAVAGQIQSDSVSSDE